MNEKRTLRRRLAVDTLLSTSGSVAAILLMRGVSDPEPGFVVLLAWWTGCAALLSLAGLLLTGNSQVVMRYASLRGYSRLGRALLIKEAGMIILVLAGLLKLPSTTLAVVALLADLLFSAIALFAPRILVRNVRREEREIHAATGRRTALVAGIGRDSIHLADESEASGRFTVLGYLSNDPADAGKVIGNRIVYAAATAEDIDALQWRLGGVDCILFPKGGDRDRPGETASGKAADDTNIPNNDAMTLLGHAVKRSFDIVLSSLLIIVFSPLALLCALAVKWEDGGPAIYSQERMGRGGKPFNILKFRSMRVDAEAENSPALYSGDDDPRLTKVGKFLRQHHLDELPQLWNVLRGDMSFIGYRPERQFYIDQIMEVNPRYRYLFQIRPGVTSYATLYNGYTDTLDKMLTRLELDLYYLRNHSLWFDARLLALTFLRIVGGRKF